MQKAAIAPDGLTWLWRPPFCMLPGTSIGSLQHQIGAGGSFSKYTDRASYDYVAQKLNETKRSREKYIREFIEPVEERLAKTGLIFDIKGRTKPIHSILNKLRSRRLILRIYTISLLFA